MLSLHRPGTVRYKDEQRQLSSLLRRKTIFKNELDEIKFKIESLKSIRSFSGREKARGVAKNVYQQRRVVRAWQ